MISLSQEQFDRLEAIAQERGLRRLTEALGAAFPQAAARAGDRFAAALAHGVQRAAAYGLTEARCVARYLSTWLVFGAEFESKPGQEWAAGVLTGDGRHQGAKAFQLCRRAAEELEQQRPRMSSQTPTREAFEAAIVSLDRALEEVGLVASMRPAPVVRLGVPCDIDAVDLRLAAHDWRRQYTLVGGSWQRVAVEPGPTQVTLASAVDEALRLPARLAVISGRQGSKDLVKLRLRSKSAACCDPAVHPLVSHGSSAGLTRWRGELSRDVVLNLQAGPAPQAMPGDLLPTMAAEELPQASRIEFSSCGVRDRGVPLGDLQTEVDVFPSPQVLLAWQRQARGPMSWPGALPDAAPAPRCRIERDGELVDSRAWGARLQDLDRQLAESLEQLLLIWEREARVSNARVSAEPAVLAGSAGLTWGWADAPEGITGRPHMRIDAMADMVACRLALQLDGQFDLGGSRSLLRLSCAGEARQAYRWTRGPDAPPLAASLKAVQLDFSLPFELQLTSIAHEGLALLSLAEPVKGAVVGRCGMRTRPTGAGLEWYAQIEIEPVSVRLRLVDPLQGEQLLQRPLLPACRLLDWSLG